MDAHVWHPARRARDGDAAVRNVLDPETRDRFDDRLLAAVAYGEVRGGVSLRETVPQLLRGVHTLEEPTVAPAIERLEPRDVLRIHSNPYPHTEYQRTEAYARCRASAAVIARVMYTRPRYVLRRT